MTTTILPDTSGVTRHEVVLGVDTHRDEHVAALLTPLGGLVATAAFPTTADGYRDLLTWAGSFGELHRAGVECTGSYGAALSRHLQAAGVAVIDVNQTDRADRRKRGKTDTLDAQAAARAVISGRATTIAKTGDGMVEAIRVMRTARNSAVNAQVKAVNQLKAILVSADPELRDSMRGLGPATLIRRCAELPTPGVDERPAVAAVVFTLQVLGRRIITLKAEAYQLLIRIRDLVAVQAPGLLELNGVGPDSSAALLIAAGDNPHRITGEASFAALCGASPVAASSGMTTRLRLNRGGDRQANAALYRIALSRLRWHPETIAYMERRLTEGKTKREIIRCLKRYIARQIFNIINQPARTAATERISEELSVAA
jgi:transposase